MRINTFPRLPAAGRQAGIPLTSLKYLGITWNIFPTNFVTLLNEFNY